MNTAFFKYENFYIKSGILLFLLYLLVSCAKEPDYYNDAVVESNEGRYQNAIELFTKALAQDKKDTASYKSRGNVKFIMKDYEGALLDYIEVLKLDSFNYEIYSLIGDVKMEQKLFTEAIEFYTTCTNIKPDQPSVYFNCALAKNIIGNKFGSVFDYDRAIAYNPKYTKAFFNMALIKQEMGDFRGAMEDYDIVVALDPKFVEAYYNRGVLVTELYNDTLALKDFNAVIQLDPKKIKAYQTRANIYYIQKQFELALNDYTFALQIDTLDKLSYYGRAVTRLMLEDYSGALADFDMAAKLDASNANVHFYKAYARQKNGDLEGSLEDYQIAAQLGKMVAFDTITKYTGK